MLHDYMLANPEQDEIALENIDFQLNRKDLDYLVQTIGKIRSYGWNAKVIEKFKLASILTNIIGAEIKLVIPNTCECCVSMPDKIEDHPFYRVLAEYYGVDPSRFIDNDKFRLDFKSDGQKPFTVDRSTGKVSGLPTNTPHTIKLGAGIFGNKSKSAYQLTDRQFAAAILHELGHIFTFYLWAGHQAITNSALAVASQVILKIDNPQEKQKYVYKVASQTRFGYGHEKEICNATNMEQIQTIYINDGINISRTSFGVNIYNVREWEVLADQYCSRMGFAADLASAVVAFNKADGVIGSDMSVYMQCVSYLIKFLLFVYSGVFALMKISFTPSIFGLMYILTLGYAAYRAVKRQPWDSFVGRYDDPKRRIEVIRNDLIAKFKAANSTAGRKLARDEINSVERAIKQYPDAMRFMEWCSKVFSPMGRAGYQQMKTQQLLEDLAQSKLNLSADRL